MTHERMSEVKVNIDKYLSHEENVDSDRPQIKQLTIDFGKNAVYGEYIKNFPLETLENTETLCYKIMGDPFISPIFRVFNFNKYEGIIGPGERLNLKILYNPNIPHRKDVENFEFVDSSFNILKIKITGDSIGPILKGSVKMLRYLLTPSERYHAKTFEMTNVSDVPAEFSFDYNEKHDIFHIEPMKGTIKAQKHIYIKISFVPKEYGSYSQQLFCLCWGGAPLMVDLHGVYREDIWGITTASFQSYSLPIKDTVGYKAYMQDCSKTKLSFPHIPLSRNYIDFGKILTSDEPNSSIEFVTLQNTHEDNIVVKWPQDKVFQITPNRAVVSPNNKAAFRCQFYPRNNNKLYCRMVTAQIKWTPKNIEGPVIPITAVVKLQGHSFPEEEYWIPNVEICPRIITLPPVLPGEQSFTNFKIKLLGHLPVIYKLIPPKKTHFVMKPMIGIVNSYEIVAIQLDLDIHNIEENKIIREIWYIELNGRKEKQIPIWVRADVTLPKILVGENNVIKFESNQPGCESVSNIPIKNVSGYEIKYEFSNLLYDYISIYPPEGIMPANEEVNVKFCYIGSLTHPKKMQLRIKLQRIQQMQLVGKAHSQTITIHTKCQYQQLCSTPTFHSFGEIQLDSFIETEFYIFNFGHRDIDFLLKVIYSDDNLDRFKLDPRTGTIEPKGKRKISIRGTAKTLGERTIIVAYNNRSSSNSKKPVEEEIITLFETQYIAVLPTLQISEIVEHNFGLLFSKEHFWNYLKIEELNSHLGNMLKGENKSILLYLPEVQVSKRNYYVTIDIENKSVYEMDVYLKRKKLCDCTMKEVAVNINQTKKEFKCSHRHMLSMELSKTKFYKNTHALLTIDVKYLLPDETKMSYILQLPNDRSIELTFTILSIPIDTLKISSYETEFLIHLKNISICRKVPPIQTVWFYNNTSQPANYQINTKNLLQICKSEDFEVIQCVNPQGTIESYSALPLMFRFQPIEIKKYVAQASIICGDQIYDFNIEGDGRRNINKHAFECQMPTVSRRNYKFPILLSKEYIPIDSVSVWSSTERIIFIKNISKEKTFQYIWEDVGIKNIVELTVKNKIGTLKPQESQAVVVKIKTFNEACITSLQLACHFLDYTQLLSHQQALMEVTKLKLQEGLALSDTESQGEDYVKHPEPFTKAVLVSLHIIHTSDRDNFFTIEEQFKSNPQNEIGVNISNILNHDLEHVIPNKDDEVLDRNDVIRKQDKAKLATVMDQLIADFVFSNYLEEVLKYSNKLPCPVYDQFTLDERKIMKQKINAPLSKEDLLKFRRKQIKKLFTRPKSTLVSQIVKDLIIDGIHDTFQLGVFNPAEIETETRVGEDRKHPSVSCPDDCKCEHN